MPTVAELEARLEAVRVARATGALAVVFPDKSSVTYKSDDDLAGAEASIAAQLAAATGTAVHTILVSATKGIT